MRKTSVARSVLRCWMSHFQHISIHFNLSLHSKPPNSKQPSYWVRVVPGKAHCYACWPDCYDQNRDTSSSTPPPTLIPNITFTFHHNSVLSVLCSRTMCSFRI